MSRERLAESGGAVHLAPVRLAAFLCVLLLAGCAAGSGSGAPSPSRGWLVGHWIPNGAHCESDAGIGFRADGSWFAYEEAGRWTLAGDVLTTLTTVKWQSGDDTGEERLAQPEGHAQRIERRGRDAYRAHHPDGEVLDMRRCPPARD